MRCKTLSELPFPPPGKIGWPWTEESPQLPDTMPNGSPWPRVSIVTPSYNQGQFIEETIRSVLLQGYPNLEYIIIDGRSTDNSVDIIHKYEQWLAYWVSEKDHGQGNAINKGFRKASGEIMAWLNSDDLYAKDCLNRIALHLDPSRPQLLCGASGFVDSSGNILPQVVSKHFSHEDILKRPWLTLSQPSVFWTRKLWELVGPLDESLYFTMDYELWLRMLSKVKDKDIIYLNNIILSYERRHDQQKTNSSNFRKIAYERNIVRFRHVSLLGRSPLSFVAKCYLDRVLRYSKESRGPIRRFILPWLPRKQDIELLSDYIYFLKSRSNAR